MDYQKLGQMICARCAAVDECTNAEERLCYPLQTAWDIHNEIKRQSHDEIATKVVPMLEEWFPYEEHGPNFYKEYHDWVAKIAGAAHTIAKGVS